MRSVMGIVAAGLLLGTVAVASAQSTTGTVVRDRSAIEGRAAR